MGESKSTGFGTFAPKAEKQDIEEEEEEEEEEESGEFISLHELRRNRISREGKFRDIFFNHLLRSSSSIIIFQETVIDNRKIFLLISNLILERVFFFPRNEFLVSIQELFLWTTNLSTLPKECCKTS